MTTATRSPRTTKKRSTTTKAPPGALAVAAAGDVAAATLRDELDAATLRVLSGHDVDADRLLDLRERLGMRGQTLADHVASMDRIRASSSAWLSMGNAPTPVRITARISASFILLRPFRVSRGRV